MAIFPEGNYNIANQVLNVILSSAKCPDTAFISRNKVCFFRGCGVPAATYAIGE